MSECASWRSVRWRPRAPGLARALAVVLPSALGCLPERELTSYAAGRAAEGAAGSASPSPTAAVPTSPAAASSGDALATEQAAPPLRGALDAGLPPELETLGVAPDAAPARRLACRAECECERRGEHDFMFCDTALSFALAVERCADAGGTLPSVYDAEQNDWLTEQMQARDADDFWLSGTDEEDEGTWRWADGRTFHPPEQADGDAPFAPWDAQQPNNLNGEDCMRSIGGVWRDLSCSAMLRYVCQG